MLICVCAVYSCQCARQFYIAQWFRDTTVEAEKTLKAQHTTSGDDQDEDFNETKEEKSTEVLQNAEKRKAFLCSLVSCSSRWQGHLKYVGWSSLMSCLSLFVLVSLIHLSSSPLRNLNAFKSCVVTGHRCTLAWFPVARQVYMWNF